MTSPLVTPEPTSAFRPRWCPPCAPSGAVPSSSPRVRRSRRPPRPGALLDRDLDDRALHRGGDRVAGGSRARLLARWPASAPSSPPAAPPMAESPAGRTTSSRRPPTSTVTLLRSSGSAAIGAGTAVRRDLVVELGLDPRGVDAELLRCLRRAADEGRVPGPPRRGTGSRSACRRRRTPSSARRDRSSAWVRSRPLMISLAINESKAPGMVSPSS